MERERQGGGGTGLEPGLLGPLALYITAPPLGWGWHCSGTSLVNRCPSSSANLSEANHVLKASSGAWQVKSSSVPTPPPILIGSLVTQEVSTGNRWPDGLLCCRWEYQGGHPVVGMQPFQNSPLGT